MSIESADTHEVSYYKDDRDLRILGLELEAKILNLKIELENKINSTTIKLENKINSITIKLGSLIIACSGILFALLSYFNKG